VAVSYRPPRRSELADCALIWYSAVDDYMARLNRPLPSPYLDPLLKLLDHLLTTDPERFLVAVRPTTAGPNQGREEVVGFGIAAQREHVWYLSQLYVLPEAQGHGIGRALLTQILPSAAAPDPAPDSDQSSGRVPAGRPGILAMCTDSAQPVSNALYAGYGIVPRMPVFNLVGNPNPAALGRLPAGIEAVPLDRPEMAEAVDAIDHAVLGYAHPVDHAHLRAGGRTGFVFQSHAGEALGYGYSSEAGRFGPIAALDDTLTAPIIGHLMHNIRPRGATSAWVPGANDRAMVALLRAGLRIEGFPALMCWTRPFGHFESYLPASLALL
jgi:GNAT superfamily N-acetyltransferase